jgi:hypothetical protein
MLLFACVFCFADVVVYMCACVCAHMWWMASMSIYRVASDTAVPSTFDPLVLSTDLPSTHAVKYLRLPFVTPFHQDDMWLSLLAAHPGGSDDDRSTEVIKRWLMTVLAPWRILTAKKLLASPLLKGLGHVSVRTRLTVSQSEATNTSTVRYAETFVIASSSATPTTGKHVAWHFPRPDALGLSSSSVHLTPGSSALSVVMPATSTTSTTTTTLAGVRVTLVADDERRFETDAHVESLMPGYVRVFVTRLVDWTRDIPITRVHSHWGYSVIHVYAFCMYRACVCGYASCVCAPDSPCGLHCAQVNSPVSWTRRACIGNCRPALRLRLWPPWYAPCRRISSPPQNLVRRILGVLIVECGPLVFFDFV